MAEAALSKKNRVVSLLIILLGSSFLLAIIGINLLNPLDTYAHPVYGFTPQPPQPTPRPTPAGDNPSEDEDGDEDDNDTPAPNRVTVQIDPCDLSCSTGAPLAAAQSNDLLAQTAGPGSYNPTQVEMLAHVQLIHEGSGWIAEGIISDAQRVSFAVPYPGQWQVFLISEPEFISSGSVDLAGTDIEELQANLSQAPLFLGVVDANTAEPQLVNCPLNCLTVNFSPPPPALPMSGAATIPKTPFFLMIGGIGLGLLGFLLYQKTPSE